MNTQINSPGLIPMGGIVTVAQASEPRWYSSCFRMPFDASGQPLWAVDLVIADRIVAPVLKSHAPDIALWRFHRRAALDEAGHQFSVLMYVQPAVYAKIQSKIDASPDLKTLTASGRLNETVHDCRGPAQAYGIAATSDTSWDPALQRAWPYFIMGVSASWLALIQDLVSTSEVSDADLVAAYIPIEAQITALWGNQGQHAFLHHLSGVYGYAPIAIQKWLQF